MLTFAGQLISTYFRNKNCKVRVICELVGQMIQERVYQCTLSCGCRYAISFVNNRIKEIVFRFSCTEVLAFDFLPMICCYI